MSKRVYVASSWRNEIQPEVVRLLRSVGHQVYDFKNPSDGNHGFHWSDIDPNWKSWSVAEYALALSHPVAEAGFLSDWNAMCWAEVGLLVMPCGRSAHLEAGYFRGVGKRLIVLLSEAEPELMYKMADYIALSVEDAVRQVEP